MDVSLMLREHLRTGAQVTIAAIPVPADEATRLGVLETDASGRVTAFHEKSPAPPRMPSDPARCYASMGNYIFSRTTLEQVLRADAADDASSHDFGKDVLPKLVAAGAPVQAYDFETNRLPGWTEDARNSYWRDVGTVEAYYEANLDLKAVVPLLDLYNREWPINTLGSSAPPAKFVHDTDGRTGEARRSIVSPGTIISGARVRDSVIGRNVRIHSFAEVEESVLMDGVVIARDCKVRRAIIDKDVRLPNGTLVGFDPESDRARGWTVTETGLTVIGKQPAVRPVTTMDL
jgi:glucose-1-phosphate adenylyltransferase